MKSIAFLGIALGVLARVEAEDTLAPTYPTGAGTVVSASCWHGWRTVVPSAHARIQHVCSPGSLVDDHQYDWYHCLRCDWL